MVKSSIVAAATLLMEDSPYAPLILFAIYSLHDRKFKTLIQAIMETPPERWNTLLSPAKYSGEACAGCAGFALRQRVNNEKTAASKSG